MGKEADVIHLDACCTPALGSDAKRPNQTSTYT